MSLINETHNPALNSWVTSANIEGNDFPIQNLPFASFKTTKSYDNFRGGVAIGDQVLDLAAVAALELFTGEVQAALKACSQTTLNDFMAMGQKTWSALRRTLSTALSEGASEQVQFEACLIPQKDVIYNLPCTIGDYTDFYTSIHHATSVGKLFRPDNPLLPNYKWVPIGYHGRSSSIAVSGQNFHRPIGQTKSPDDTEPSVGPCKRLDYELEMGIYIGSGNNLGERVSIDDAEDYVFGLCLFNDWSARDIQAWEYQPLGPFLAKNFASTVSPWIITTEALAPYRAPFAHPDEDPCPLDYLSSTHNSANGNFDIQLEVLLETTQSKQQGINAMTLAQSNFKYSYWTVAQMVAHHTINGCNMRPGDLLGSGTQSGPVQAEAGSMLELCNGGKEPFTLENGETRTFLEDGDSVIMRGWCEKPGAARIGFGEVIGTVLPAK